MKRFEAFFYGDAWVKGILELDFGASTPRFAFVAERADDLPRKGRIKIRGRVEGFAHRAQLPSLGMAGMYSPPPGHRLVMVSPQAGEPASRTWLALAVAVPMDIIEAVAEHRS